MLSAVSTGSGGVARHGWVRWVMSVGGGCGVSVGVVRAMWVGGGADRGVGRGAGRG